MQDHKAHPDVHDDKRLTLKDESVTLKGQEN